MDIILKTMVWVLICGNLLVTMLIAAAAFYIHLTQTKEYLVAFSAFMTVVFIATLLLQFFKELK